MMALEKTRFDDWLKDNLWRDLIFRSAIWVLTALLATYLTLTIDAVDANSYFKGQTNSIFRLLNVFGTIAIFTGLVAMMFKDMEVISPIKWGRDTSLGGIGGFFRRLSGDLTLWTLGSLLTVLVITTASGFMAKGATWNDWAIFSFIYLLMAIMCSVVAALNIHVRRAEPLLANKFKNPYGIGLSYIAAIIALPIYIYYTP